MSFSIQGSAPCQSVARWGCWWLVLMWAFHAAAAPERMPPAIFDHLHRRADMEPVVNRACQEASSNTYNLTSARYHYNKVCSHTEDTKLQLGVYSDSNMMLPKLGLLSSETKPFCFLAMTLRSMSRNKAWSVTTDRDDRGTVKGAAVNKSNPGWWTLDGTRWGTGEGGRVVEVNKQSLAS